MKERGPSKYDDQCTRVREETNAKAVVLVVIGGDKGAGCAAQGEPVYINLAPLWLRELADQIEADFKQSP